MTHRAKDILRSCLLAAATAFAFVPAENSQALPDTSAAPNLSQPQAGDDWEQVAPKMKARSLSRVESLQGTATVTREDRDPVPLKVGDPIFLHDRVDTMANSSVGFLMRDLSVVAIGEKSRFILDQLGLEDNRQWPLPLFVLRSGSLQLVITRKNQMKLPMGNVLVQNSSVFASYDPKAGRAVVLSRPNAGGRVRSGSLTAILPTGDEVGSVTAENDGWNWVNEEAPVQKKLVASEAQKLAAPTEAVLGAFFK